MSAIDFYIRVVKSLDEIEAPYEARNLGEQTLNLWNEIVARAEKEIHNRK